MTGDFSLTTLPFLMGLMAGTASRCLMLQTDYRRYPGYPHGYVAHLALGFIASTLGALAVPALAEKQYTAATFLALAAQQFRDIRKMEHDTLLDLEEHALVRRGKDYVDGIAKVFEARNYLVIGVALFTSLGARLLGIPGGVAAALASGYICLRLMSGREVGQIALVKEAEVRFEGPNLFVGPVQIMNIALAESRQTVLQHSIGVVLEPKNRQGREILADPGQRQAIIHDASAAVGIRRDVDNVDFTPLARRNLDTGAVALFIPALDRDPEVLLEAVRRVPVLETARGGALPVPKS